MNRVISLLLLLLPLIAIANPKADSIYVLNKDSVSHVVTIENNWRFKEGDLPAMADTAYDDSRWELVNSHLYLDNAGKHDYEKFNGIGWFRLHIYADTSVVGIPLALQIKQSGASELYFDGKQIETLGVIKGKDSSEYYNPHTQPIVFIIPHAGNHVLAIRYANFDAQKNFKKYTLSYAGFILKLQKASDAIATDHGNTVGTGFSLTLFFGIFLSLCLSHLFLFLYNKEQKSNLFFSFFCLGLSALFFMPLLSSVATDPAIALSGHYVYGIITSLLCFSFSGFINDLFCAKKLRFIIFSILCAAALIVYYISDPIGTFFYFSLIIAVSLEAMVVTVRSIYRKVRGARIIGAGILIFALFTFLTVAYLSLFETHINYTVSEDWFGFLFAIAILSIPISISLYLAWNFSAVNKDLKMNLEHVQTLSATTLRQEQEKQKMIENQKEKLEVEVAARTAEVVTQKEEIEKQHKELKIEKEKSDSLLLNILPEEIAEELKEKGHSDARLYNDVSVLFTDFVDFTKAGERMEPQQLVDELHICFKTFDEIIARHNIEKIKTIGDAYLAVGGLPAADNDHATNTIMAALEIREFMAQRKILLNDGTFEVRLGVHSGSVVAGIVGIKKFAYDIWGDTVNTAARMEQNSERGKINISQATYELIKDKFECTPRGAVTAKNKGELDMYFVEKMKVRTSNKP